MIYAMNKYKCIKIFRCSRTTRSDDILNIKSFTKYAQIPQISH